MIGLVFALVVLVLALTALLAALLLGWTPRRRLRGDFPLIERERDVAASLEVQPRAWLVLRTVTLAGCLAVGLLSGIPFVGVLTMLVGLFGVPWLVAGSAARRRLRRDRALLETLRDVATRVARSGTPLDAVLRDVAQHPRPELARLLAPLATAANVDETLADVVDRSRSPIFAKAYLALTAGRSRQPRSLAAVLSDHLLPAFELDIELAEQARSTGSQMRAAVSVIGLSLAAVFAVLNGQETFHDYFVSAGGQVALVIATLIFAASMAMMALLMRPPRQIRWDVQRARLELERLRRG